MRCSLKLSNLPVSARLLPMLVLQSLMHCNTLISAQIMLPTECLVLVIRPYTYLAIGSSRLSVGKDGICSVGATRT